LRARWVVGLVVLVLGALAALWWSGRDHDGDRAGARAGAAAHDDGAADGEGIRARTNDPAHMRVLARIVDDDAEPLEGGTVTLSCLVDDTVVPIAGGTVTIQEDGALEGPGCAGTICAELHHPAAIAAEPWVLEVGRPVVLRAAALPRLWGIVEDASGEPIVDASVQLVPPADAGDDPAVLPVVTASTSSDGDGFWSVALIERPPCDPCREAIGACAESMLVVHDRIEIHARGPGHAAAMVELDLTTARGRAPEDPVRVRLGQPAAPLSGTLGDPEGQPYPRAHVLARSVARPVEQHRVLVEDAGAFTFNELGEGEYELRAMQDGVELVPWTPAAPGDRVALAGDRRANGPDVIVVVTDGGRPAANVRVDGGPFRDASTDMQGQVRAERVLPGPLRLRLRPGGQRSIVRTIDVPDTAGAPGDARSFAIELSSLGPSDPSDPIAPTG
jgi:hypothetical protein